MSLDFPRALVRRAVNRIFLKPLSRPFELIEGSAWRAPVPRNLDTGRFLLYEGQDLLGPADSPLPSVVSLGRGHYGWHDGQLTFSTSDNSDPNTNGRRYAFSDATFLARRRASQPRNYQAQDVSPQSLDREVDRLVSGVTRLIAAVIPYQPTLRGARVLEVGPGINYGWLILAACAGATTSAVDAYPTRWADDYHAPLFRRLRARLAACEFVVSTKPIDQVLEQQSFDSIPISGASLEQTDYPDDTFDLVFSNAVLEHLYDLRRGTEQLYRVTRPGGIGCHWVDFRDHRDFSRPLEYLLLSDEAFAREFGIRHGECGNRFRQDETAHELSTSGFEILDFEPTFEVEPKYLAGLLPRLRRANQSSYRNIAEDRLRVLHGRFVLRKPLTRSS